MRKFFFIYQHSKNGTKLFENYLLFNILNKPQINNTKKKTNKLLKTEK